MDGYKYKHNMFRMPEAAFGERAGRVVAGVPDESWGIYRQDIGPDSQVGSGRFVENDIMNSRAPNATLHQTRTAFSSRRNLS